MLKTKGFTLIELLVVIAIIGLLSSVVVVSLNTVRMKGRDAKRLADLKEVQKVLELYASDHGGKYPVSSNAASSWTSQLGTTPGCYGYTGVNVAPMAGYLSSSGVFISDPAAPKYIPVVPQDPKPILPNNCYVYLSDGTSYKFLVYGTVESFNPATTGHPLADKDASGNYRNNSFSVWYSPTGVNPY